MPTNRSMAWCLAWLGIAMAGCGGDTGPGPVDAPHVDGATDAPFVDGAADGPLVDGAADAPRADGGAVDASLDAALPCAPSGVCPEGPECGGGCCGVGERCVNGVCMCANGAACGIGDICDRPGPISPGACGLLCCGVSQPCPQ